MISWKKSGMTMLVMLSVLMLMIIATTALAMTSTNYAIDSGGLNSGGGMRSSASYTMVLDSVAGLESAAISSSVSYSMQGGLVAVLAEVATTNVTQPFTFTSQTGALLNTVVTSNRITVSGLGTAVPITVAGGAYSKNGGLYTSASGTVANDDTVAAQLTTAATFSTLKKATVTINGVSGTFNVTTVAKDTTPEAFSFPAVTNAALSTVITSSTITISGINSSATISITGGTYSINGGAYTSLAGTITEGKTVTIKVTSSASFSTTKTAKLSVGGVLGFFSVTTLAKDTTPDAFSFTDQGNVELNSIATSNTIMVSGINSAATISIAGGSYLISGGSYTTTAGTIANGKTVMVQVTAAATYATPASASLTIGGVTELFTVTTPTVTISALNQAVDNPALTLTTGGTGTAQAWFGQNSKYKFGGSSAQSGLTGNKQSSWLETTVSGPFSVAFFQKISSETTYDTLAFTIDGVQKSVVSGIVDWKQKGYAITTAGTHTLRWTYAKNGSKKSGMDAAWVDRIVTSPTTAITVLSPNGGEVLNAGTTASITWKAPAKAEKYLLYYSKDNGTVWSAITATYVTGTSYDWTVPSTGKNKTTCLVKVEAYAYNSTLMGSDQSNTAFTIQALKVNSPNGGEAFGSTRTANIAYSIIGTNKAKKVKISYTLDNEVTWKVATAVTSTMTATAPGNYVQDWLVPTVTAKKANCKVKVELLDAANVVLATDKSDNTFIVEPLALAPPVAPLNLTATAGVGQVTLNWSDVASTPTVSYYTVYWSLTTGFTKTTGASIQTAPTTTTAVHTTPKNGVPYYYVVTATNANGESPASLEATATPVDITAGLISYYPMDNSAMDSAGVNHGTVSNATLATGITGTGYAFNDTSSFITAPGANMPLAGASRTLSAWINTNDNSTDQAIVGWGPAGAGSAGESSYLDLNSGSLRFNGFGSVDVADVATVATGTWYHVAAVYSGTTGTLYVNGIAVATDTPILSTVSTGTINLYLGKYSDNTGYFNGTMDEVGIWNRALSAEEVAYLYNNGTGIQVVSEATLTTDLVSEWKFDNNLVDSANANDGMNHGLTFSTPGKLGSHSARTGTATYATLPIPAMDIATTSGTLGFWVKGNAWTASNWPIADVNSALGLNQNDGSGTNITLRCGTQDSDALSLNALTWYYLMIEWDHGTVNFYQDNVLMSQHSGVAGTTATVLRLGQDLNGYNADLWLDEMALWSRVLNSTEKADLYNGGAGVEIN